MKIKTVTLKNVKSFLEETTIEFNPGSNIFIGPNAGGKSNILEIIQAVFNDLLFVDISIGEDKESKTRGVSYKTDVVTGNRDVVVKNIFDKFSGHEDEPQRVSLLLTIEKDDVVRFENFKKIKDDLIFFEKSQFSSEFIKQCIESINFDLDCRKLIGNNLRLEVIDGNILEPNNLGDLPFCELFRFIKFSEAFANFIRFLNAATNSTHRFRSYFIYISPYRNPINLSDQDQAVDLSAGEKYDAGHFKQKNQTQDQPSNIWQIVIRILVENVHDGNETDNDFFKRLLSEILGIDFEINKDPNPRKIRYNIRFYRNEDRGSIKLSSGEKEFLNLISLLFVRQIKNGIVFIDEPELHLHPRWQKKLASVFDEISLGAQLQLVTATHSPSLITLKSLTNLLRVYKNKDTESSQIAIPDTDPSGRDTKGVLKIITASNNEKIFFADKVVLVEGIADRIILEPILKQKQKAMKNNDILEIVEVLGKHNFQKFEKFLDSWKVPWCVVADRDYLKQVGTEQIKKYLEPDPKRIKRRILKEKSKDGLALTEVLISVTDKESEKEINADEFKALKKLVIYLKGKHTKFSTSLTSSQKKEIGEFIKEQYKKGVYILKKGEIEDYFGSNKFDDVEEAINIASTIEENSSNIPSELGKIIKDIVSS